MQPQDRCCNMSCGCIALWSDEAIAAGVISISAHLSVKCESKWLLTKQLLLDPDRLTAKLASCDNRP